MQWIAVVHVVEQATELQLPEADESPLKSPMWPSTESAVSAALELVRVLSSRLYAWVPANSKAMQEARVNRSRARSA
eukprot:2711926-Alexandrium_andersonii.AAC.1